MTQKKRQNKRRTHKRLINKGGALKCNDINHYRNKVIYLGVDLDWKNLSDGFNYELVLKGGVISFTAGSSSAANANLDISKLLKDDSKNVSEKNEEYKKLNDALDTYLGGIKWKDDDKNSNFNYNLSNVIIPRYQNSRDKIEKTRTENDFFLYDRFVWEVDENKQGSLKYNDKNILKSDMDNEFEMFDFIHKKLVEFKSNMQEKLKEQFKIHVKNNILKLLEIHKYNQGNPETKITRNGQWMVSGKIYVGIKIVCSNEKVFELHELIIPNAVDSEQIGNSDISKVDDKDDEDLKTKMIELLTNEQKKDVEIKLQDIDSLLLFGKHYGKHNIRMSNKETLNFDAEKEVFKILRKKVR